MSLRQVKNTALERVLKPAGFVKGQRLFIRRVAEQVHGVELQPSKYGGQYFVNLGFTYAFLPVDGEAKPAAELGLTDFTLRARPGQLIPGSGNNASSGLHDIDAAAAEQQVEQHARVAVGLVDDAARRWSNPATLLKIVPPELLEKEVRLRRENYAGTLPIREALGGWETFDRLGLACALTLISLRAGEIDLAQRYLQFAEPQAAERMLQRLVIPLRQRLEAVR